MRLTLHLKWPTVFLWKKGFFWIITGVQYVSKVRECSIMKKDTKVTKDVQNVYHKSVYKLGLILKDFSKLVSAPICQSTWSHSQIFVPTKLVFLVGRYKSYFWVNSTKKKSEIPILGLSADHLQMRSSKNGCKSFMVSCYLCAGTLSCWSHAWNSVSPKSVIKFRITPW